MKLFIYLILTLFVINSCSKKEMDNKYPQEMPKDFEFVIDSGANDKYDSNTQTFTRKYIGGSKNFVIPLNEEVRNKIYQRYKEIDFLNIPSEFEIGEGELLTVMPSSIYSINICERTQLQKCHKVSLRSYDLENNLIEKQKAENFKEFYDFIWDILQETPEYKGIPESDMFYM